MIKHNKIYRLILNSDNNFQIFSESYGRQGLDCYLQRMKYFRIVGILTTMNLKYLFADQSSG